jgi:hypothetical protein
MWSSGTRLADSAIVPGSSIQNKDFPEYMVCRPLSAFILHSHPSTLSAAVLKHEAVQKAMAVVATLPHPRPKLVHLIIQELKQRRKGRLVPVSNPQMRSKATGGP